MDFKLNSNYQPSGDQQKAIAGLCQGLLSGTAKQTLLGVTGSGKTFTIANVIANLGRPTLVVSPNKTLAAQLYQEFKEFFPHNSVGYFVSYYDYYQPEAYIPHTDTFIEKATQINDDIDRLRLAATSSVSRRQDLIIVASVSCLYGLGSPEDYEAMVVNLRCGQRFTRRGLLESLVNIQYDRAGGDFTRGKIRMRGDNIEIYPAYEEFYIRLETFDDQIESIKEMDPLNHRPRQQLDEVTIFPAKHFVLSQAKILAAVPEIEAELNDRVAFFESQGRTLEAVRLRNRTQYDIAMLKEMGYCNGIENYSRILSKRQPGERPFTLFDYFPDEFLVVIDESHVTLPQIRAMYRGDRARKETLVEYGFRLPCAYDNRPLIFEEFEQLCPQTIYLSATPGDYELEHGHIVEQIIRPTGLLDPPITVVPIEGQIDHLLGEIHSATKRGERTLVLTLTKKMSEDLSQFLLESGVKTCYLHSDIAILERSELIRDLRLGRFDVLVGINLLREGLDLPEVSQVAILDADKEGFLRSPRTLIQICGRAARHINGRVIMYGNRISRAMQLAIDETERRRTIQAEHNRVNGITPHSVHREVQSSLRKNAKALDYAAKVNKLQKELKQELLHQDGAVLIAKLEKKMLHAAASLEFESAAALRDQITFLKNSE